MPQPLLVHYHIFKNAGTSVERVLATCFGTGWVRFEGAHAADVQSAEQLRAFLRARPAIRALSSHLARPPLPAPHCLPIVMLRHPVDRARSVYQFVRRDPKQPHHHAARGGFAAFVKCALDFPPAGVPIANYQVYHLSDASFRSGNHELASRSDDLVQTQALIASWPAFGLVRQFAESCRLFETIYAPMVPELQLHPMWENASPDSAATEEDALDAARAELGPALWARLCEANELDLLLHGFARRLFEKHVRGESWSSLGAGRMAPPRRSAGGWLRLLAPGGSLALHPARGFTKGTLSRGAGEGQQE
jgi:hypothetical protein